MSKHRTMIDPETGEWIHVYDLEKCLKSIRKINEYNENRIKYIEE